MPAVRIMTIPSTRTIPFGMDFIEIVSALMNATPDVISLVSDLKTGIHAFRVRQGELMADWLDARE